MNKPIATALTVIILAGFPVLSLAEDWGIEDSGAPSGLLRFEATGGTWISVDVSPSGDAIVFDLLGHLYEMSIDRGLAKPLTKGRSWNMLPRYSPDDRRGSPEPL